MKHSPIIREGFDVTSEYNCWAGMKYRCNNPKSRLWKYYGGRGISVCKDWDSFDWFLFDMGRKPSRLHSIDRVDNNGNYNVDNCRWATKKEQGKNRRSTVFIEGVMQKDVAKEIGISPQSLKYRIDNGLELKKPRPVYLSKKLQLQILAEWDTTGRPRGFGARKAREHGVYAAKICHILKGKITETIWVK